jgi:RHS repeat-associated protein
MTVVNPKESASGGLSSYDCVMPVNAHDWCGFPASEAGGRLDAENRLVAVTITATGHRSEFGYDGLGRRVEIIEKDPDATQTLQVTSDKKYLWDGVEIAEERDATGGIVQKRFYSQGFVDTDGTILFYTRDHLGSIRELTDSAQAVRARYDYDPYGRMTKVQGDKDSLFGYAMYFWHGQSGLNLTKFRAYDPNLGRWISEDPYGELGGINLYGYVLNNPISYIDPLGLEADNLT